MADGTAAGSTADVGRHGSGNLAGTVRDLIGQHLDIEADDVEAEAQRMVDLGAERVGKIESWWVLRAPTGHLFCVVPTDH